MLRKSLIAICVVLVSAALTTSAFPWGSGTHLYIAERVNEELELYQWDYFKFQHMYGATAPDISNLAAGEIRDELRHATHYDYQAVIDNACWQSQEAFAAGFKTHTEKDYWGADHYAHLEPGYVRDWKNERLGEVIAKFVPLTDEELVSASELYIEVGIDLLLEKQDAYLGEKLREAASCRSRSIPSLLAEAYPEFVDEGLLAIEEAFRLYLIKYGDTIALPPTKDKVAMAAIIALLAKERYETEVTPGQSLMFLEIAMKLCTTLTPPQEKDYITAIEENIDLIIEGMNGGSLCAPPKPGAKLFAATAWGEIKKAGQGSLP